jgi:hypothetical protein
MEEIRRNLPSPLPVPTGIDPVPTSIDPVPTSIDPHTLDKRNISGTSSLTPNSLTNTPVKKLTERLPNPPAYSGKRSKLRSFIN